MNQLPVYSLHDKGDVRQKRTGKLYDEYSVSLSVSEAEWDDFSQQVKDAIDFLRQNNAALMELISCSGDINAFLDFPLWSRLSGDIVNQNDYLPKDLISLAGELGLSIGMSIYAVDAFDDLSSS